MHRVRVAQIGTGHDHAIYTFISLIKNTTDFEVVGIAETNPERIDALNTSPYCDYPHFTLQELLAMPELDAVAVESDEELATDIAQKFLDRGVAVHLDKPGTADIPSFEKVINTARLKQLPLQMGYMYRYNPVIKQCLEMVRAGKLGKIYSVEAHMSVHHSVKKRKWLEKYPGGIMYFLGCHLIDLVLLFQGMPDEVIPLNVKTHIENVDSTDYGFAVFKYERGLSFIKTCSVEYNGFARRQLVIAGEKGTIVLKPLEAKYEPGTAADSVLHTPVSMLLAENETDSSRDQAECWDSGTYDRYDDMMHAFSLMVRGEEANPYSYDYELQLFKIVMQCCGMNE